MHSPCLGSLIAISFGGHIKAWICHEGILQQAWQREAFTGGTQAWQQEAFTGGTQSPERSRYNNKLGHQMSGSPGQACAPCVAATVPLDSHRPLGGGTRVSRSPRGKARLREAGQGHAVLSGGAEVQLQGHLAPELMSLRPSSGHTAACVRLHPFTHSLSHQPLACARPWPRARHPDTLW